MDFIYKWPKLHNILNNIWFPWSSDIIGLTGQAMVYMVPLKGFTRQPMWHMGLQKLTSSVFFSKVLTILSHISEKLSNPRLTKYTGIKHFIVYTSTQHHQNSWQLKKIWTPKSAILAHLYYTKIPSKRNFSTKSTIFS